MGVIFHAGNICNSASGEEGEIFEIGASTTNQKTFNSYTLPRVFYNPITSLTPLIITLYDVKPHASGEEDDIFEIGDSTTNQKIFNSYTLPKFFL